MCQEESRCFATQHDDGEECCSSSWQESLNSGTFIVFLVRGTLFRSFVFNIIFIVRLLWGLCGFVC